MQSSGPRAQNGAEAHWESSQSASPSPSSSSPLSQTSMPGTVPQVTSRVNAPTSAAVLPSTTMK